MSTSTPPTTLRYCDNQGTLVGARYWLPTDPFDFDWRRRNPVIGCNNIHCSRCEQQVMASQRPESGVRRYACRCTRHDEVAWTVLGGNPDAYPGTEIDLPWSCVGHPALAVPTTVDGVEITPASFVAIARQGFASPPFVPPGSSGLAIWVSRLYWILPEPLRPQLGEAVSELFLDPDPKVALGAMRFYIEQRTAAGGEKLTAIARDHGARLAKTPDPLHPGYFMEDELLAALEFRGFRRDEAGRFIDPEAHELLRTAMRAGKNPEDLIYTFGRLDPEWLAEHAAEIVANAPSLLGATVYLLRDAPAERRRGAYRAIAAIGPSMRKGVREVIQARFKGEERDLLLAQLEG